MEKKSKNIAIFTHFRFWQKGQGADIRIARQFELFDKEQKFLIFYGKLSKKEKKIIINQYGVKSIFTFQSKRIELIRYFRKFLSIIYLNRFYTLRKPFTVPKRYKKMVDQFLEKNSIDIVLCNYIWMSDLFNFKSNKMYYKVIETHDSQYLFCKQNLEINKKWTSFVTEEDEFQILKGFDMVLAVSTFDYQYFSRKLNNVFYLPWTVPLNYIMPTEREVLNIGFIGGKMLFNSNSVKWFIQNVFSFLEKGKYVLNIYGNVCKLLLAEGKIDGVRLHGFIENSEEIYSNNDIMINPVSITGGIKTKNVECLAHGVPLMTTSMGSKGLEMGINLQAFFVSDDQNDWIDEIIKLNELSYREQMGRKGYQFASQYFSNEYEEKFINTVKNNLLK